MGAPYLGLNQSPQSPPWIWLKRASLVVPPSIEKYAWRIQVGIKAPGPLIVAKQIVRLDVSGGGWIAVVGRTDDRSKA